jgi:hypothetical protein
MKWILGGLLLITLVGTAAAENGITIRQRFAASASAEACLANCSSNNANCKRVCPAVLGAPCLASCDSQYQTCTQGCQNK